MIFETARGKVSRLTHLSVKRDSNLLKKFVYSDTWDSTETQEGLARRATERTIQRMNRFPNRASRQVFLYVILCERPDRFRQV
jgi:hypothetical protein